MIVRCHQVNQETGATHGQALFTPAVWTMANDALRKLKSEWLWEEVRNV